MDSTLFRYDLGRHVTTAIDLSMPLVNYVCVWGDGALEEQRKLFERSGLAERFDDRVVLAASFETEILEIVDKSYSGYTGNRANCQGYDGIFTRKAGLPIFSPWSDCPTLIVAGKYSVGIVHAARATLDQNILRTFFERFLEGENPEDVNVAFSPYIFANDFDHTFLDLKRSDEWIESGCISNMNGVYYLDLGKMVMRDLLREGILEEKIQNAGLDSVGLSKRSVALGGRAISHRYAKTLTNNQRGNGGLYVMLLPCSNQ